MYHVSTNTDILLTVIVSCERVDSINGCDVKAERVSFTLLQHQQAIKSYTYMITHPTAIVTYMYKSILVDKTVLLMTPWAYPYMLCHVLDRNARNDSIGDLSLWINHTEITTTGDFSVKIYLIQRATQHTNTYMCMRTESVSKPNTEVTSLQTLQYLPPRLNNLCAINKR